jgi:hypothetical protein
VLTKDGDLGTQLGGEKEKKKKLLEQRAEPLHTQSYTRIACQGPGVHWKIKNML